MRVKVYRIGAAAVEALELASGGSVAGVTSRGAFLRVADRIIYLTPLDYRSPFNLTLAGDDQRFERLSTGDPFAINSKALPLPASRSHSKLGKRRFGCRRIRCRFDPRYPNNSSAHRPSRSVCGRSTRKKATCSCHSLVMKPVCVMT